MYKYKVVIENVTCSDTESIHSGDKLVLSGLIATGNKQKGYALPLLRINTGQTKSYPADTSLLFDDFSKESTIGIVVHAVDIDQNDGWYENKENIKNLAVEIGKAAVTAYSGNPIAGNESGKYIDTGFQFIDTIVTFFIKNDKNDTLGNAKGLVNFNELTLGQRGTKNFSQAFREHDDYGLLGIYIDYNDYSYTIIFRVECEFIMNPLGAICSKWESLGAETGFLGSPISIETKCPDKEGFFVHFQGGSIYWSEKTNAHIVKGSIRDKWAQMGWENSDAGFPIEDEKANSGNSVSQEFEKGVINKKGNEIEFVANRTRIRSRPRSDVFTPR
ncbi:hypothetical protein FHS57_000304 [Runella defluvii]|uniref:LGFP repeat-containing protein n=1 Tax=Runella defluvii TaxID=370973 RepID=A0A7W5ZI61_9BACT|nr:hypothetical protein [Runella defluvii]MBB3836322.1 hypothetical protein [Runella defluvii]